VKFIFIRSRFNTLFHIELISLVRHMRAYPNDSLGAALRNVFDFDIYKPETIDKLAEILEHHGFVSLAF
jgi:hypothetical protein